VLAVSVFLPWYGVSFTPGGVALAQQAASQVAEQFGNASTQAALSGLHSQFAGLAGHEIASLSAHQVLHDLNVILLALAALALLDALVPLARGAAPLPAGAGRAVVLLGGLAAVCVAYRMVHPPVPAENLLALSLREGAWLALIGSLMIALGGVWPHAVLPRFEPVRETSGDGFTAISGWTHGS